ncbi:MAG: phosphate/phosphite/phosphonate ABC transporter substrate-binding protein, partial [Chloroflexota bacterium]
MLLLLCIAAFVISCSAKEEPAGESSEKFPAGRQTGGAPLILSILPVERAGEMYGRFLPLKYYLENALKRPVVIKVAKDYETAMYELGTGEVHLAYLDPATYCEVRARYGERVRPLVRAAATGGAISRSVLVTKSGGAVQKLADLRGKRLALGTQQSSFSYLIPLAMLHDVGIAMKDFASVDFLQQEDRVALSVLVGTHDVGGISESVAGKYADDGLTVVKRSEVIPQFFLCASAALGADVREEVVRALIALKDRGVLAPIDKAVEGFIAAQDRDFDVVRVMMKNVTAKDYIEYRPRTIRVAVLPLYSALTIYDRYDPLMRYLSEQTGFEFKLVIPKSFEDFMDAVRRGRVDFSYQNPFIFALLSKEMAITPLVTTIGEDCATDEGICGEDRFRGVIITRHDSGIRHVGDLKGKRVFIVSPKSAGGYLSQRLFLKERGIDIDRDMQLVDVKKQEKVLLGVYRGEADAGFVRESAPTVWREDVDLSKIRIVARTNYLPNWPVAACRRDRPELTMRVKNLLAGLTDEKILA